MDHLAAVSLLFASALQILCWALPVPKMARLPVAMVSGALIMYSLAVFALIGANAMRLVVPQWFAIALCVVVGGFAGGLIGAYAWRATASGRPPMRESVAPNETLTVKVETFEERVAGRVRYVTPLLQQKIGFGDKIEYDFRGDSNQSRNLEDYARRIEAWRTEVGQLLAGQLPNSGADTKFLEFSPTVGQGPIRYEYDRLVAMRRNLVAILDNLETYARRSLAVVPDQPEPTPSDSLPHRL
jgi:hypothetical protein